MRLETGVISSVDRGMYESLNQSGKVPSERRVSGFNPRLQRLKSLLRQLGVAHGEQCSERGEIFQSTGVRTLRVDSRYIHQLRQTEW